MEHLLFLAENNDTLLTGFSGVVILLIVVWLVMRFMKKRSS